LGGTASSGLVPGCSNELCVSQQPAKNFQSPTPTSHGCICPPCPCPRRKVTLLLCPSFSPHRRARNNIMPDWLWPLTFPLRSSQSPRCASMPVIRPSALPPHLEELLPGHECLLLASPCPRSVRHMCCAIVKRMPTARCASSPPLYRVVARLCFDLKTMPRDSSFDEFPIRKCSKAVRLPPGTRFAKPT
jgi:hypothetical protein